MVLTFRWLAAGSFDRVIYPAAPRTEGWWHGLKNCVACDNQGSEKTWLILLNEIILKA